MPLTVITDKLGKILVAAHATGESEEIHLICEPMKGQFLSHVKVPDHLKAYAPREQLEAVMHLRLTKGATKFSSPKAVKGMDK
jgi:hypothetical protein